MLGRASDGARPHLTTRLCINSCIYLWTAIPPVFWAESNFRFRCYRTPISTATTEGTVQWLLHRRMGTNQQMRWTPRGAHCMLKVRTAVANDTLAEDHAAAERWARRPFRPAA